MKRSCWAYYLGLYRQHRLPLFLAVALSIAQSLVVLPVAILIAYFFNHAIKKPDLQLLTWIGLGVIFLQLSSSIFALLGRNQSLNVTKSVIKLIRDEVVARLYAYPQEYYDTVERSKLHSVVVQDTERLDIMSNALISIILPAFVMILGLLPILFYLNWSLSLFLILVITPLYFTSGTLKKRVQRFVYIFQRTFEHFSEGISSILHKMELTRSVGAENYEIKNVNSTIERLRQVSKRVAFLQSIYTISQSSVVSIGGILVLIVGGWSTGVGHMTMGDLIAYYFVVGLIRNQLRSMIGAFPQFIEGQEALMSLCNLVRVPHFSQYEGTMKVRAETVHLKGVYLKYNNKYALEDINMTIPSQGIIVVTGGNGAGKSSLINLILGLYLPQEGKLYVNGYPYSQVDIRFLRRSFGIVPQNPILFQGTIWENITYGIPQVNKEDVIKASKMALAHQFIVNLSDGYRTVVGERGIRLSGGERQRIAIARAFLRNPQILLLDEPMTFLDKKNRSQLTKILKELGRKKSIFINTHNLNVISQADLVYYLDQGKIDFIGKPEEYLKNFDKIENMQ